MSDETIAAEPVADEIGEAVSDAVNEVIEDQQEEAAIATASVEASEALITSDMALDQSAGAIEIAGLAGAASEAAAAQADEANDVAQVAAQTAQEVAYASADALAALDARIAALENRPVTRPLAMRKEELEAEPVEPEEVTVSHETGSKPESDSDERKRRRHRFGR